MKIKIKNKFIKDVIKLDYHKSGDYTAYKPPTKECIICGKLIEHMGAYAAYITKDRMIYNVTHKDCEQTFINNYII